MRAIIDAPDDDVPRLVYADWLDEQGEADRAEWIRVQDELARHDPVYAPYRLSGREARLQHAARRQMLAAFLEMGFDLRVSRFDNGGERGLGFRVRRGFVEGIEVWGAEAARLFAERAADVFALTPLLHLRFHAGISSRYGRDPEDEVDYEPVELPDLQALLARPELRRLRSLDLFDQGMYDDYGLALLGSPHLAPPTRLYTSNNYFGPVVRNALIERFGRGVFIDGDPVWADPE